MLERCFDCGAAMLTDATATFTAATPAGETLMIQVPGKRCRNCEDVILDQDVIVLVAQWRRSVTGTRVHTA